METKYSSVEEIAGYPWIYVLFHVLTGHGVKINDNDGSLFGEIKKKKKKVKSKIYRK